MNADDDEFLRKTLLPVTQLRDVVQAIYSTEGPKLEQDDFAAQLLKGERARDIQPLKAGHKFGRVNFATQIGQWCILAPPLAISAA